VGESGQSQVSSRSAVPVVSVESVTMQFHGLVVLRDVSVSVEAGSAVAIIGPNGSGKTTLLNVISGIYRPVSGRVRVGERPVTGIRPHRVARLGVGRTFQHVELPRDLTLLRIALLGRHTRMKPGVVSYSFGLPYFNKTEREHRAAALDALRLVELDHLADYEVGELPYGIGKRADLARALAGEPSVLLLDEPAAGMNDRERQDLLRLLNRIRAEKGLSLVVIEHDMTFVTSLCSHAVVLVGGEKIFDDSIERLRSDDGVMAALLGGSVGESDKPAEPPVEGEFEGRTEVERVCEG
jgi:branched-chain amino acid transport system ATP-binding protein